MGFRSVRVSDIGGIELDEKQAVNVAVREHPSGQTRQFDASVEELKALKPIGNLVSLEFRFADGRSQDVFVTAADFAKLISDDKLAGFDALRGRRKGFRPGGAE